MGVGFGTVRKSVEEFLRPHIVTFPCLYAFQIYCRACAPARHFYSLPKISPCSPGFRWMAFGLRRAKVLR